MSFYCNIQDEIWDAPSFLLKLCLSLCNENIVHWTFLQFSLLQIALNILQIKLFKCN